MLPIRNNTGKSRPPGLPKKLLALAGASEAVALSGRMGSIVSFFPSESKANLNEPFSLAAGLRSRQPRQLFADLPVGYLTALEFAFNVIADPISLDDINGSIPKACLPVARSGNFGNLHSGAFDLATVYGQRALSGDVSDALDRCLVWPWDPARLWLDRTATAGRSDLLRVHNVITNDGSTLNERWFTVLPGHIRKTYFSDGELQLNRAVIPDARSDRSLMLSQFHAAVIGFHNAQVAWHDEQARNPCERKAIFEQAKTKTQTAIACVFLHDVLPRLVDPDILTWCLENCASNYEQAARLVGERFVISTEAIAVIQLLTSLYNPESIYPNLAAYASGKKLEEKDIYAPTGDPRLPNNLFISARVPTRLKASHLIDWRLLCSRYEAMRPATESTHHHVDNAKLLDSLQLEQAAGVASGFSVARVAAQSSQLHLPLMSDTEVGLAVPGIEFRGSAPLGIYVLAEAERHGKGGRLGPLGSLIVAEIFVGAILRTMGSAAELSGTQELTTFLTAALVWKATNR